MDNAEVAVFNQDTYQDKHYHKIATEIYLVLEGKMTIDVEDEEFELQAGDMIVVNPNSIHKVKSDTDDFICSVIAINSQGKSDKYIIDD